MQIGTHVKFSRPSEVSNNSIKIRVLNSGLIWILHHSSNNQIIEMIPEIKFAIMKLLIHSWEERLTCFDCNCRNMSERKSVRWERRNRDDSGRSMPAFKLNLVIYNRAIFLHPSKRKDRKGEVLAKICEKYLTRVCVILVLVRSKSLIAVFIRPLARVGKSTPVARSKEAFAGNDRPADPQIGWRCYVIACDKKKATKSLWIWAREASNIPNILGGGGEGKKITIILTIIWIQIIFP